jgi:hypothetical protein
LTTPTDFDISEYYQPHSGQQHVHASGARIKCLKIGRRWGKSRSAFGDGYECYTQALQMPAPSSLIPPWHGWALSPTFPQSRQIWNEALTLWPSSLIHHISHDERTIYLKGSEQRPYGILEFKSAHDPDSLQTVGLDWLWIQESQDVSDAAFEKILPTMNSPGRMGRGFWEGIPSLYPTHWFERSCRMAEDGRDGYAYFHATAFDNPLLDDFQKAEIEAHRELLPERAWRRMYLAEFNEDAGYFSNISACISGDLLSAPLPGAPYVGGLDLGRKVDPSVLTIMDAENRKVVQHHSWDVGAEWPLQRDGVIRYCREWNISRLVVDATGMGGDIFVSEMTEASLPVEPYIITPTSRESLLQTLVVALERQTIQFPNITPMIRQLRAFQYRKMSSGRFRAEAPPSEHDDEVFSLALALTACADAPSIERIPLRGYRSGRYVPTQAEAENGGIKSRGAQGMRDRIIEKTRARQEQAGIS